MLPSRLRIGLLIDSDSQPRWVRRIVAEITASDIAAIVLVVVNAESPRRPSVVRRLLQLRRHLLYGLYRRFDEWLLRARSDAFEPTTIADLIGDVPRIEVLPERQRGAQRFGDDDATAVERHGVDVMLRFGFGILRGRILTIPRYGVWSYHHGDNAQYRGQPAGIWEVIEGAPVSGAMLQVLSEDLDNGRVLYRSYSTTSRYSAQANRNRNYWKASTFVMRKLRELSERGAAAVEPMAPVPAIAPYSRRMYRTPDNLEMLRGILRIAGRVVSAKVRSALWREQWFVAYRFGPSPTPNLDHSLHRFKRLIPPSDRFWADPFPVKVGDEYFIFLEEYLYEQRRAHISVVKVGPDGAASPVKVLERPYHLSYPFVFEWRQRHYMVPETSDSGRVELYSATSFPYAWTLERTLLEGIAGVDPTLAEIDGAWWLFLNIAPDPSRYGDNDELHLYHAETPLGPWQPHARNPIKSDVRSARPAGRLFRYRGDWYRPSQDSSLRYGYGIRINRIDTLTPSSYAETEVARILPEWHPGLLGNHTFNQIDGLCCIDGLVRRRKF